MVAHGFQGVAAGPDLGVCFSIARGGAARDRGGGGGGEPGMANHHAWQPQEEGVKEICGLLLESKVPSGDQNRVWQQLQRCNRFPDFNNYLAFILCRTEVRILRPFFLLFSLLPFRMSLSLVSLIARKG